MPAVKESILEDVDSSVLKLDLSDASQCFVVDHKVSDGSNPYSKISSAVSKSIPIPQKVAPEFLFNSPPLVPGHGEMGFSPLTLSDEYVVLPCTAFDH